MHYIEELGKILYVSDYSDLGNYAREQITNNGKDFFQIKDITNPNEREQKILNAYDTLIFLSYHVSEKQIPSFTVHHTGNWEEAWGGEEQKLSIAVPYLKNGILHFLKEYGDLDVSMEVTHHGPTLDKKILFVEVFKDYYNEKRADLLIEAALKLPLYEAESVFGYGGNHYCASFNKLVDEYSFGHICPKYRSINENTFLQAIKKSFPKAEKVLIDKKGTKSEGRNKIKFFCEKYGVDFEFI